MPQKKKKQSILRQLPFDEKYDRLSDGRVSFSEGELRSLIEPILTQEKTYLFVGSTINQEAIKLVRAHSLNLTFQRYGRTDEFTVMFDQNIGEEYLRALDHLVKQDRELKCVGIARYGLVHDGAPGSWNKCKTSWPEIHVIASKEKELPKAFDEFKRIFYQLHGDAAYELLRSREAPQNYNLGTISLLHEHKINPLVLEERIWKVQGAELKNALDYLDRFRFSEHHDNDFMLDD